MEIHFRLKRPLPVPQKLHDSSPIPSCTVESAHLLLALRTHDPALAALFHPSNSSTTASLPCFLGAPSLQQHASPALGRSRRAHALNGSAGSSVEGTGTAGVLVGQSVLHAAVQRLCESRYEGEGDV